MDDAKIRANKESLKVRGNKEFLRRVHDGSETEHRLRSLFPKDQLCEICKQYRVNDDPWNMSIYAQIEIENAGNLHRLKRSEHCIICRLALCVATSQRRCTHKSSLAEMDEGDAIAVSIFMNYNHEDPPQVHVNLSGVNGPWKAQSFYFEYRAFTDVQSSPYYPTRGEVAIECVKAQLRQCLDGHGATCKVMPGLTTRSRIKLIDIILRKLLWADTDHTYLALSYAWGTREQNFYAEVATSLPNAESSPTDLTDQPTVLVNGALPQTMEDAISLAKALDVRYLWIDALCINQQDDFEKTEQLPTMAYIYQSGLTTIIPLCGDSVHSGTPGVARYSRRVRQIVQGARDLVFFTKVDTLSDHLSNSRWHRRGWTYLEACMSTRCLLFSCDQVFLACASDIQAEGFVTPTEPLSWQFGASEGEYMYGKSDTIWRLDRAIEQYTQRRLGYSADSLNTFRGLMTRLEKEMGFTFWHGHRLVDFKNSLLWHKNCSWVPPGEWLRFSAAECDKLVASRAFPSWSWPSSCSSVEYGYRLPVWWDKYDSDSFHRACEHLEHYPVMLELNAHLEGMAGHVLTIQSVSIPLQHGLLPETFGYIDAGLHIFNHINDNSPTKDVPSKRTSTFLVVYLDFVLNTVNDNSSHMSTTEDLLDQGFELLLPHNYPVYEWGLNGLPCLALLVVCREPREETYKRVGLALMPASDFCTLARDRSRRTFHLI